MAEALFPFDKKDIKQCRFEDMHLQVGQRVEIQRIPPGINPRLFSSVIGYAPGESLLVRTPLHNKLLPDLQEGDRLYVRASSGTQAFGFATTVQRLCIAPFHYMHLAVPGEIQCVDIRRDQRFAVNILAEIKVAGGDWQPALMRDLAEGGSLVEAAHAVGEPGTAVELRFTIPAGHAEQEATLTLPGKVHKVEAIHREDGLHAHRHGIEFEGLGGSDALLLQNFLFHLMFDHPLRQE